MLGSNKFISFSLMNFGGFTSSTEMGLHGSIKCSHSLSGKSNWMQARKIERLNYGTLMWGWSEYVRKAVILGRRNYAVFLFFLGGPQRGLQIFLRMPSTGCSPCPSSKTGVRNWHPPAVHAQTDYHTHCWAKYISFTRWAAQVEQSVIFERVGRTWAWGVLH